MNKFIFSMILILASVAANAATLKASGVVTDIWMFTKNYTTYNTNDIGLANIYIDSTELGPACGVEGAPKRIAISTDHPLYDSVVSMALTSKTANKKVEVWHLDTCSLRSSSWDFALIRFVE